MIFKGSRPVLLRNIIFLWFFSPALPPPPSGSANDVHHYANLIYDFSISDTLEYIELRSRGIHLDEAIVVFIVVCLWCCAMVLFIKQWDNIPITAFFLLICEMRYLYSHVLPHSLSFSESFDTTFMRGSRSFVRGVSNFDGLFFCFFFGWWGEKGS